MSSPLAAPALTLLEAAGRLEVSQQRVSQLLAEGSLSGPQYPGRAPKNAPRVWEASLIDYERDHTPANALSRKALAQALADRDVKIAALEARLSLAESPTAETLRLELAAARAAAQELNVGSDVLIERVEQLSEEVSALKRSLAQQESELASLQARYDLVKSTLDTKSSALTQLLTSHTPPAGEATD